MLHGRLGMVALEITFVVARARSDRNRSRIGLRAATNENGLDRNRSGVGLGAATNGPGGQNW